MSDLDVSVLASVLRFVHPGADALISTICVDPPGLLAGVLGQAPSAAQLASLQTVSAGVQTDLDAAGLARAQLTTALASPLASTADVTTAATALAGVLQP